MNYINQIGRSSLAASGFTGNLQALGTLTHTCAIVRIVNNTNKGLDISFDGVTNHDFVCAGDTYELNLLDGQLPNAYALRVRQGTTIYISAASGTGDVYLAAYY